MSHRILFTHSLRERWVPMAIATAVICLWLPLAMAIYRDIDTSLYTNLPEPIRELMGIPPGADAAALAYNVMLTFAAALAVSGVAISIGASTVAGDEERGTLALVLATGASRRRVLAARTVSLASLVGLACAAVWVVSELSPRVLDVGIGSTHLGAMTIHLAAVSLFHGALALAVGAATGDRSRAAATATSVMLVSYVATGILPLVDSLAPVARIFPWYHFGAGDPLVNGAQWSHLLVLITASVVALAWSVVAFGSRDIGSHSPRRSLRTLLNPRRRPMTLGSGERRAIPDIWMKSILDHRVLLTVVGLTMFTVMGLLMGPMYTAIESDIASTAGDLPDVVLALAGNGDLSTPEGWFQTETFSLMAPIAVMIVAVVLGTKGVAGEEAAGRMSLVLAQGVSRRRVVLQHLVAMTLGAASIGLATAVGVSAANEISSLDMSHTAIAATSALATLLGLVFGALALLVAALTGQVRTATYAVSIAALTSHLLVAFLPLTDGFGGLARMAPHHYFLTSDPLANGMHWGHGAILAVTTLVLAALAAGRFERRDIRSG